MLSIDIIESKTYIDYKKTGESILDLVTASWDTSQIQYELRNIAVVSQEGQMRPDLVSLYYMGNSSAVGSMLKINGISNPLSLEAGEILLIPGQTMVNDLFAKAPSAIGKQKRTAKSFRKELQEKISKVSDERMAYLNSKNISNLAQTPLPPNMLKDGEQQILIENGKLIFGPSIGQCRSKIQKNISVTDIKTKLVQKNLFNR